MYAADNAASGNAVDALHAFFERHAEAANFARFLAASRKKSIVLSASARRLLCIHFRCLPATVKVNSAAAAADSLSRPAAPRSSNQTRASHLDRESQNNINKISVCASKFGLDPLVLFVKPRGRAAMPCKSTRPQLPTHK